MKEEEFQAQVIELAKLLGWMVYHTRDSRRSPAGFPDLILIRGKIGIAAELKVGSRKPTAAQLAWVEAFGRVGFLPSHWRPEHWVEIQRTLQES